MKTSVVGKLSITCFEDGNESNFEVEVFEHAILISDDDFMLRNPRYRFAVRNAVHQTLHEVEGAFDSMISRSK